MSDYDIAIVGGGINGVAIARDAAGRGLRVVLVEQGDLGSGTSSASTKLVHGGLRYLEHWAFRLVRESLAEREVLMRIAPHAVRPLRFLLPPTPGPRSPMLLRLGLFLYDWLGERRLLPPSKSVDLTHHPMGASLKRAYRFGFEYSDCRVDDARLVILTAMDAAARGASIRPRARLTHAERGERWKLVLNARGRREVVTARALVNAAGPWAPQLAETVLRTPLKKPMRLIKGSHIVVRKRFEHGNGYLLQTDDRRVIFALPFAQDFTLIGTTDEPFIGDLAAPAPSPGEVAYLCRAANVYFRDTISPDEVVWSFSGVRSLEDDGAGKPEKVTRDWSLHLDEPFRMAPLLTLYGGKLTTHRKLAEAATDRLAQFFATAGVRWTHAEPLPGGNFRHDQLDAVIAEMVARWPFLTEPHARRLAQAYGTRAERFLAPAHSLEDLGETFGGDLTAAEVRYLVAEEWAQEADDVLWRRTKLGLAASPEQRQALAQFMAQENLNAGALPERPQPAGA